MTPRVVVLTACHDRASVTAAFLDMIARQTWRPLHLIAVDDGSRDATPGLLKSERRFPMTLIQADGLRFWGGSMALALRAAVRLGLAAEDVILFLNDDVSIAPGFIATGVAALPTQGTLLLACGRDPDGRPSERGQVCGGWRLRPRAPRPDEPPTCAPTRGLFVRWGDVRRIGNFAASVLPHYGSDYEWTIRAVRRGLSIRTDPHVGLDLQPGHTGVRERGRARGLASWRLLRSPTYAEAPFTLIRFASRVAPWPRAAWELVVQLLRATVLAALRG